MGWRPDLSASGRPEARAPVGARGAQPEVDVVPVRGRPVAVPAQPAAGVVADGVGPEAGHALGPVAAVPDDLLDAHAARERLQVAPHVWREQEPDEAAGLTPAGRIRGVEMPV